MSSASTYPQQQSTMQDQQLCRACQEPLLLEIGGDDDDGEEGDDGEIKMGQASSSAVGGVGQQGMTTVPDDVLVTCGCHFHWQCILDTSLQTTTTLLCPSCTSPISTTALFPPSSASTPQIPAHYTNEGGASTLDLYPLLREGAYLLSNPSARPARALATMCAEGDVYGIVDLLTDACPSSFDDEEEEEEEEKLSPRQLLFYQDPLANQKSLLHVAVEKAQAEVVWLLLWSASALEEDAFPADVRRLLSGAGGLGRVVTGGGGGGGEDIRGLKDGEGRTAGEYAEGADGIVGEIRRRGLI